MCCYKEYIDTEGGKKKGKNNHPSSLSCPAINIERRPIRNWIHGFIESSVVQIVLIAKGTSCIEKTTNRHDGR